jgi:pimeloyl-ACP methyl ester carboxylesterase
MTFLALPTVTLHFEVLGSIDSPPLLLLHGATETFPSTWGQLAGKLAERFQVIGPDLRGHGQSTNPTEELDLRVMADDMIGLLDHLGIRRANVCGFSGGASVALFMAVQHLERLQSLILISNNFELDRLRTGRADFWNPKRVQLEEPRWWEAMSRMHQVDAARLLRWWDREDRLRPNFHATDLAGLWVPALVIGGDRDRIVPLEQTVKLFEALPDAQLAILPGIGHGIPGRRPTEFLNLLLSFLARQQAPPAERVDGAVPRRRKPQAGTKP